MNAKLEMSDEVADRRVVEQKEKKVAALINWKVVILVYKRCFFLLLMPTKEGLSVKTLFCL